jgi:hypothetical protein
MPILFTNVRPLASVDVGSGGMPFSHQHVSPGFALVGLVVRAGSWIDQVTPIFAELYEDGSFGSEVVGPACGGYGGTTQELRVMPGHLVTGIQTRSGSFVDAVRLLQSRWDGTSLNVSDSKWTQWVGGSTMGGVERPERMIEAAGTAVAIGIAGRAGTYVDNLTLVGAELVRVSGTVVAKGAGRNSRSSVAAG